MSLIGRYYRTVRNLTFAQMLHRVRLRSQRALYQRAPRWTSRTFQGRTSRVEGWPASFRPLDAVTEASGKPSLADNRVGIFELLDLRLDLGQPIQWNPTDAPQLWRYHLHYFDWAWAYFGSHAPTVDKLTLVDLYKSWRAANEIGKWDAWSPYVASVRAWTICSLYADVFSTSDISRQVARDLETHARYLRANLEYDVGGNHLLKNLKALCGLAVFLRDVSLLDDSLDRLVKQLDIQILPDGGHFERSPSYHAQVLGDLIDVRELLRAAAVGEAAYSALDGAVERMRAWLARIATPDYALPPVNDTFAVSEGRLKSLGVAASDRCASILPESGYVVGRPAPDVYLLFDVGRPSPPELPAHGHADALSVILKLGDQWVLADTGTSTYAPGSRRLYERSSRAHNTVEIDLTDQSEVWGAFRLGRQHNAWISEVSHGQNFLRAAGMHDGYRHMTGRPLHSRTVELTSDRIRVVDEIVGAAPHTLRLFWHLGPHIGYARRESGVDVGPVRLVFSSENAFDTEIVAAGVSELGYIGAGHNRLEPAPCVVINFSEVKLPLRFTTDIWLNPASEAGTTSLPEERSL